MHSRSYDSVSLWIYYTVCVRVYMLEEEDKTRTEDSYNNEKITTQEDGLCMYLCFIYSICVWRDNTGPELEEKQVWLDLQYTTLNLVCMSS